MGSEAEIRADIYSVLTTLDAVSNIGVLHDYERWALHLSDILTVLKDPTDDVIRAWMIVHQGYTTEGYHYEQDTSGRAISIRTHRFMIRGVRGLDDANESEKTFAVIVESVCDALDKDSTLHNQDAYYGETSACNLDAYEVRILAGVLCHVAEISQQITAVHALT